MVLFSQESKFQLSFVFSKSLGNYKQLSKLIFVVLEARVWYVSHYGDDVISCGRHQDNSACKTLDYVIPRTQSSDRLLLVPSQSNMTSYSFCASQPIRHDLTIEGVSDGHVIITCREDMTQHLQNLIFIFENANIEINHITFTNGSILGTNATNLNITNSLFRNSEIFLMDRTFFNLYSNPNFTLKELDKEMTEAAHGRNQTTNQCSSVNLSLQYVEWDYGNHDNEREIFLDSLIQDGIQVICRNVRIDIADSELADKQLFIYSIDSLDFKFRGSSFVGLTEGRLLQGGIKLNSFVSPSIMLENSSISGLLFSDFFLAIFSAQQYITAAMYLRILDSIPQKSLGQNLSSNCTIRNTIFEGNFRALNFQPHPGIVYTCHVTGTTFSRNHVLTDGGAIVVNGNGESLFDLRFTDCYFEENQAGSQELDFPEDFPIKIHHNPGIVITSFEETEEESLKIYMELHYEAGSNPVKEFVFLDVSGSGGAVFVGTGSVHVADSLFVGNSAAMYGGAIHVVIHGALRVSDSVLYSPDYDQELEDGTLISSFGRSFILENVTLHQVSNTQCSIPSFLVGEGGGRRTVTALVRTTEGILHS